jgi:ribitol-5-phosphate 2-dehydrogenase
VINRIYRLVEPRTIDIDFESLSVAPGQVLVAPQYMAICHADQRYFQGARPKEVLARKLPMALIHECWGRVVNDPDGRFKSGDAVVLIPNIPGRQPDIYYENYGPGSGFASSGYDGFMRELVALDADRVVAADGIAPKVAAITEFVSVAEHALARLKAAQVTPGRRFAILGDGAMGFTLSMVLRAAYPKAEISVLGRHREKLALFTQASHALLSDDLPNDFVCDQAFDCTGGNGSTAAIDTIIDHIMPEGCVMLMGVSEQPVAVNTRMVLERGLTLVGCSRSGRADFEAAIKLLQEERFARAFSRIIYEDSPVEHVADVKRVFTTDLGTPFKTVFRWGM